MKSMLGKTLLAIIAGGSIGLNFWIPAQAQRSTRMVHLDVHRYCQRIFRTGATWKGRQYTDDGWHRYNRETQTHECGFHYRTIGEASRGGSGGFGINVGPVEFGIQGSGSRTDPSASDVKTKYEPVWIKKACREQNNDPKAQAFQDIHNPGIVWCVVEN